MNRFKLNGGDGALVCNTCDRIIQSPITMEQAKKDINKKCPSCTDWSKLDTLVNRLRKINIDIKLISNVPWIYLDTVNENKVKEIFRAEHGFTIGFLPVRIDRDFVFTDLSEIFKIIRKYK